MHLEWFKTSRAMHSKLLNTQLLNALLNHQVILDSLTLNQTFGDGTEDYWDGGLFTLKVKIAPLLPPFSPFFTLALSLSHTHSLSPSLSLALSRLLF